MKTILIKKKKKYHEDDLLTDYSDQQENNYQQDSATRTLDMNTHTKKNQKIGLILNTKIVQKKKNKKNLAQVVISCSCCRIAFGFTKL